MSVKELKETGLVASAEEKIIIEHEGKTLVFYAKELGYFDNTRAAAAQQAGQNILSALVASSIRDEAGNKFTLDEVEQLHPTIADKFLGAVLSVNKSLNKETPEKK